MPSRLVLIGVFTLLLLDCSRPPQTKSQAVPARVPDPQANDIARFLAGIPGRPDGPFHALESNPAWLRHKENSDRMWAKFEQVRLPAMRAFQQKEMAGIGSSSNTVLYPFGGPDVLTVTTLFPNHRTYILIGLEPPGTLPTEGSVRKASLDRQLPQMELTLDSLLRRSFFITASMDRQLRGQVTDGLFPVMLVQLARRGYTVLSHRPVTLNDAGEFEARTGAVKRNRGVSIEIQSASGAEARVIYLAANLNNAGLNENLPLRKLIARSAAAAFFKSTSYMPHRPDFSLLRELILKHATAIVQDDSGIPFRFIDPGQWNTRLYGRYWQPYGSFRHMVQRDLRKAYQESAAPLGFSIGYGFGRAPSALQIFSRKSPPRI